MIVKVTARDGAVLAVESTGSGPGLVVVHGGGVTTAVYRRLASRLAGRLTVHLYNRRGRADAPVRREPYRIEDDIADLADVLSHTGTGSVLGHSSGGLIALEAARVLPIDRLVLYDAAVDIDGHFPSDWLDPARSAARRGDTPLAMALTTGGVNTHSGLSRLPLGVRVGLCRAFLRTSIGATMGALLPSTLDESAEVRRHAGSGASWAAIEAEVLLSYGTAGPGYYRPLNEALGAALPHATVLPLRRCGHDGVNRASRRLTDPIVEFLTRP